MNSYTVCTALYLRIKLENQIGIVDLGKLNTLLHIFCSHFFCGDGNS